MSAERDARILANLGLVHACARRLKGRGIEYDDLFQAGCTGLIKACDGFDAARGFRFSSYAVPVILGEMRRLFREGGSIKVSRSLRQLARSAEGCRQALLQQTGEEPRLEAVASELGCEPCALIEALAGARGAVSLEAEAEEGREPAAPPDTEEQAFRRILLSQAFLALEAQQRALLYCRFLRGLSQVETAQALGVSQAQISRGERKLLASLRAALS